MAENTAQAQAVTIGQGLDRQRNEGFTGRVVRTRGSHQPGLAQTLSVSFYGSCATFKDRIGAVARPDFFLVFDWYSKTLHTW